MVTYGHKKLARTIKTTFLVLPLITSYHCVVGRPTLAKLGDVASTVHLKMKFHSLSGKKVTISADINSAERCQYLALKGIQRRFQDSIEVPPSAAQVCLTEVDARYDPDSSKEEEDDDLARELIEKNKRPEPHGEFIEVPLGEDPTKTVKLGVDLPRGIREDLISCLRQNADLFVWSAAEMPRIPLEVACHHLAVNPDAKCVAQKRRAQSEEKAEAAAKAVADLLAASFINEVK